MRHRQRPARLQLALEQGNDRAARAEDVAEPHRHEACRRRLAGMRERQRLAIAFGAPLAGAHHVRGVDCLVGRDQHHRPATDRDRRVADVARADRVGPDGLDRIALDQRDVLQRRGMEHDLGPEGREAALDQEAMPHVDDARHPFDRRPLLRHFGVDRVEIEFGGVDEADRGRTDGADLPHDFRADRSAGAGHQHAAAGDEAMHGTGIEHDLRPPEQVLDRDRLQFGRVRGAGPEPGRIRPPRHRQAQPVCALDQRIEPRRAAAFDRPRPACGAGRPRR